MPTSPADPGLRSQALRAALILEEAFETAVALVGAAAAQNIVHAQILTTLNKIAARKCSGEPNLAEAIDGCMDVLVVTYGTMEVMGVDAEPFFDEVMRANMEKVGGPVREDGKILKPSGWSPPDITGVLRRMQEERG